jgi:site-specific DNA-adenine methylase
MLKGARMIFDNNEVAIVETVRDETVERMIEYIRSVKTIEEAMEPYKEQKRELREEYKEQGWLTKDEISMAVRAYRMMKSDVDIQQFVTVFNSIKGAK